MCTGITIVIGITGTNTGIIVTGIEMETGIETEIMIGITIEMTDRTGIDRKINGSTDSPGIRLIPLTRQFRDGQLIHRRLFLYCKSQYQE